MSELWRTAVGPPPAAAKVYTAAHIKKRKVSLTKTQRAFLAAYEEYGTVAGAARAVGCERTNHNHRWLSNPEYEAAFKEAKEASVQFLETEIRRRALEGDDEPVIYQGKRCYEMVRNLKGKLVKKPLTIKRKSDNLGMFILKGERPEKYRDNWRGEIDHKVEIRQDPDLARLTLEQLQALHAIAEQCRGLGREHDGSGEGG